MPSVNMGFFADVLPVLERHFGKRAANQQQINDLIKAAGELEREFLCCPLMPVQTADTPGREVCEICDGAGILDDHTGRTECYNCNGTGER